MLNEPMKIGKLYKLITSDNEERIMCVTDRDIPYVNWFWLGDPQRVYTQFERYLLEMFTEYT